MSNRSDGSLVRQIRALFHLGVVGERTDGQLLERFAMAGGEAADLAFAALVERHGPMVWRICRGVLHDPNDAEDAFQATFLVLVRRARSLWVADSLGPWLHRVARRIALRARAEASRRRDRERLAGEARPATIHDIDRDDELISLLHEEIDRLPERCRVPVVLCDVEGLTHEQAARHLGWPIGTVKSRLMKGRARLRERLGRRGVAPAVATMKLVMATPARPGAGSVPAGLVEATARAARLVAAGAGSKAAGAVPASVTLLMEGALDAMFATRIRFAVLAAGLVAGGAVVAAQQAGQPGEAPRPRPPVAPAPAPVAAAARDQAVNPLRDHPDGAADLKQEMDRLELSLLQDEVELLHTHVGEALKDKVRYEASPREDASSVKFAEDAYEKARQIYLEKARELGRRRRAIDGAARPPEVRREPGGDVSTGKEPPDGGSRSHASGAAVGSIDLGAVLRRCERFRRDDPRHKALDEEVRRGIARLQAEAEEVFAREKRYGAMVGGDAVAEWNRLAALRRRIESEKEALEAELATSEARTSKRALEDIQAAVAAVANARGLDYVVKVSHLPTSDAAPAEVVDALNRPVLYANPRNDITEDVIRELNHRFEAGGGR